MEAVFAASGFDVAKELEGDQQAADGGAGERGGAGNVGDGHAAGMPFKGFDYAQAAGQREDEVGIAFVRGEFAAPARPIAREILRCGLCGAFNDGEFSGHGLLASCVCDCGEHIATRGQRRLQLFDGKDREKLGLKTS